MKEKNMEKITNDEDNNLNLVNTKIYAIVLFKYFSIYFLCEIKN